MSNDKGLTENSLIIEKTILCLEEHYGFLVQSQRQVPVFFVDLHKQLENQLLQCSESLKYWKNVLNLING
jgi:hypothetical protein